ALRELDQAQNVSRTAIARREAALRALNQEQTAQPREPSGRSTTDKVNERLKLALRETEQAKQQIARGKPAVAALALRKLARQLDAGCRPGRPSTFSLALFRHFIFDAEAFGHAVERSPVNAHDFRGARAVAAHHL